MVDEGFEIKAKGVRRKPLSKDTNAETFWADFDNICNVTQLKEANPKWGASKISKQISTVSEGKAKKFLELYFFDSKNQTLFRKSQCLEISHRPCVTKEELIELIRENHRLDHRKGDTIYEFLRRIVYPVVRETVLLLLRTEVINCIL